MLKSMGVNALRTSHNPPAPELLDMADRMGFLVMDEAFDCWDQAKNTYDYARFFSQWSTTDIGDMVARDRNHPGIIIWSIGNEIQDNNNTTIASSLISAVKAKDSTRAIGQANASAAPGAAVAAMEDVVGLNYAPYSYDGTHSSNPSWKLFASESSSAVRSRCVYKTPVTTNILTSSDNQCSSYDNSVVSWGTSAEGSWSSVNTRAFIAGEFIWTGWDYIGEPTPYGWPSKSSYFGAIDTAGFPKDIFYFYQSKWGAAGPTMVHIVPMDWTTWTAGSSVTVWVYSNADSVELFLNGTSLGSKTMSCHDRAPRVVGQLRDRHAAGEGDQRRLGRRDRHGADGGHGGEAGAHPRPRVHHRGRARPVLRRGGHRGRAGRRRPQATTHDLASRSAVRAPWSASTPVTRPTTTPTRGRPTPRSTAS